MDLQPASPTLIEAIRTNSCLDLPPPVDSANSGTPAATPRPNPANGRVQVTRQAAPAADEVLIPDQRAGLTPAQSVERKLTTLLRGGAIPASHFRMAKLSRRR
jgi:hypothetical protein